MTQLSATAAKRRGFLVARIAADQSEIEQIDERHAAFVKRLEDAAAKGADQLAARQARLDKLRGVPAEQPAAPDDGA